MYKNVLITGGASGLGKLIAEHLQKKGHKIYVLDKLDKSKVETNYLQTVEEYYCVNLSSKDEIKNFLIDQEIGKIDILINNAAIRSFKLFRDRKSVV